MPRATTQKTKYPGVYKRETTHGTVYDIAVRIPGEPNPKWERGKWTNLEDAHKRRLTLLHEIHHGGNPLAAKTRTFEVFATTDWLDRQRGRVAQGKLQESTRATYEGDLRRHILPAFGSTRLDGITVEDIERWQDRLSAEGRANWYVRKLVTTLGGVLELARRRGLISSNPAHDVEKPEAKASRAPLVPTFKQVRKLAEAAPDADEHNLILVAAFTGARISELFGLRWPNVRLDDEPPTLLITEQCYQGTVKDRAKTPSGHRQIILPAPAVEALRAQQVEGRSSPMGLVFPSPFGGYWLAQNFNRRRFKPMREKASLQDLNFHDLRHFYVSHVRAAGLPSALTEQLAGHSDERTHRGYTHAIPGTERMIYEKLSAAFKEAPAE